jgi:hypothetical protein
MNSSITAKEIDKLAIIRKGDRRRQRPMSMWAVKNNFRLWRNRPLIPYV